MLASRETHGHAPDGRLHGSGQGALLLVVATVLVGCSLAEGPQPQAPSLTLRYMPPGTGCPLEAFSPATVRIDPGADEPVIGVERDGTERPVLWEEGFQPGRGDNAVVLDSEGHLAARDGDVIVVPPQGFAELRGHTVCAGSGKFFVFLVGPK